MKKILTFTIIGFIMSLLIISCNDTTNKDITNTNNKLKEANQDVKEAVIPINDSAKKNAIASWKFFKSQSELAIARMEQDITKLEAKMATANNTVKEKILIDINNANKKLRKIKEKLQQKNSEFENDMNNINTKVISQNESFQREFNHDMNELANAFKDLFRDNVK